MAENLARVEFLTHTILDVLDQFWCSLRRMIHLGAFKPVQHAALASVVYQRIVVHALSLKND